MTKAYVYFSLSLPDVELRLEILRIRSALERGGWRPDEKDGVTGWRFKDLRCDIVEAEQHGEDIRAGRVLPANYRSVDVTIGTLRYEEVDHRLPWEVLAKGMRRKDERENPTIIPDLSALTSLCPFQVELGCGASIEAGVPPLHHLHELYRVTEMDSGRFIFGGVHDDLIARLLISPGHEFARLGTLFTASFLAEPTPAHNALLALRKAGRLVGDIMTNNFDGLAHRVGLREHFLRRYDETIPDISLKTEAKALLVIGSHADRRRVQARARARGMKVIYLDPEGYWLDGRFIEYPLEGPRNGDLVCRKGASDGLTELCALMGIDP